MPDDEWGLVIDQVVGLAAVYDIPYGQIRTPEEVHDLWVNVTVAIAEGEERRRAYEVEDAQAERDDLRTERIQLTATLEESLKARNEQRSEIWRLAAENLRLREAMGEWAGDGAEYRHALEHVVDCAGSDDQCRRLAQDVLDRTTMGRPTPQGATPVAKNLHSQIAELVAHALLVEKLQGENQRLRAVAEDVVDFLGDIDDLAGEGLKLNVDDLLVLRRSAERVLDQRETTDG